MTSFTEKTHQVVRPHLASGEQLKAARNGTGEREVIAVTDRRLISLHVGENEIQSLTATSLEDVEAVSFYRYTEDEYDVEMKNWSELFMLGALISLGLFGYSVIDSNGIIGVTGVILTLLFAFGALWAREQMEQAGDSFITASVTTNHDDTSRTFTVPGDATSVVAALSETAASP
ncbi:hypothetical protein ACLI4U_07095 [Natrialbaceae archaeon A-CW2]|uniref:hypothetical protein n=1 Tax=Natronosalvus amylolyticus TaxID=2961994 RepID=UPI0020CA0F20|nr:hypothetical protein [Natronosalvus amylolyticus]